MNAKKIKRRFGKFYDKFKYLWNKKAVEKFNLGAVPNLKRLMECTQK